jgi:hypothetical protein
MNHSATATLVRDDSGEHAVVTDADDEIWIHDDLWAEVTSPGRKRIPGDMDIDGDTISFGTPGEGMGRLTYRLVGREERYGLRVAKRIDETRTISHP